MLSRMAVSRTAVVLLATLVAGCATSRLSTPHGAAAAVGPVGDLSGAWHGSFGQVGSVLYIDESNTALQIDPDGTFTATVKRGAGANNLAKPAALAGTVVMNGERVTLRNSQGRWPWIILTRSGDDVLYGLAIDPAIEAPVMLKFERGSGG